MRFVSFQRVVFLKQEGTHLKKQSDFFPHVCLFRIVRASHRKISPQLRGRVKSSAPDVKHFQRKHRRLAVFMASSLSGRWTIYSLWHPGASPREQEARTPQGMKKCLPPKWCIWGGGTSGKCDACRKKYHRRKEGLPSGNGESATH